MDNENEIRASIRDIELRMRSLEERVAVLVAISQQQMARVNNIPGWVIAGLGLLFSAIGVLASMWATGRTP